MKARHFAAIRRWLAAALLATAFVVPAGVAAAQTAAPAQPQRQQPQRQDEFVPVDQLPPQEQVPAAPLLIGAYAVAWVAILGYVWSLWSRLSRVEKELADVGRRVDAQARR